MRAGPIAIKAAVLTAVERMHAGGYGLLYSGWPQTWFQVRLRVSQPFSAKPRSYRSKHCVLPADAVAKAILERWRHAAPFGLSRQ